jgi:hypothetical protein
MLDEYTHNYTSQIRFNAVYLTHRLKRFSPHGTNFSVGAHIFGSKCVTTILHLYNIMVKTVVRQEFCILNQTYSGNTEDDLVRTKTCGMLVAITTFRVACHLINKLSNATRSSALCY